MMRNREFDAAAAADRLRAMSPDREELTWAALRDAALSGDSLAMGLLGFALYQHGDRQGSLDTFCTGLAWICRSADAGNEHAQLAVQGMEQEFAPGQMAAIRAIAAEPIQ